MVLRTLALIGAAVAATVALAWANLGRIVDYAVTLDPEGKRPGLNRLKIGYRIAGGKSRGAGDALARATKKKVLAAVLGAETTKSRLAWRQFLSTLSEAEHFYLHPSRNFGLGPDADDEIAEGTRMLTHLVRSGLELYLESDPLRPTFTRLVSPTLKLQGDNPDAVYFMSIIDAAQTTYRVRGKLSNEVYFSLAVHCGGEGGAFTSRVCADVKDIDLSDDNGAFDVYLSTQDKPDDFSVAGATWLKVPADANSIVSRHYFEQDSPAAMDPDVAASIVLDIEAVDLQTRRIDAPRRISDAATARKLRQVSDWVRSNSLGMPVSDPTETPPFFSLVPNTIGPPAKWSREKAGLGAVDIAYGAGPFLLRDGEALVMEGRIPKCRFANVVLWNRFLQSLDYTRSTVSLNRKQMKLDGDRFVIVVSQGNPGDAYPNWISTEGRGFGTIFWRFVLPEEEVPTPTTRVVRLESLRRAQLRTT